MAAWTDGRTLATTSTDIYGVQIAANGTVAAVDFVISNGIESETNPSVAESSAVNNVRVAYEKRRPDLETIRVQSRQIGAASAGGQKVVVNAQCGSGFALTTGAAILHVAVTAKPTAKLVRLAKP